MHWRRLRADETDHELLWLLVTLAAAVVGVVWLRSGLPTPRCVWHELLGFPCLGCGGTRCARHAIQGDWLGAFLMNPLVFVAFAGVVIYDVYAAVVIALRLPRLRFGKWPAWAGTMVRVAIVTLIFANWAWLIVSGV